ncbi:hypothetical protein BgiMline_000056 [Biomphalaria glabrata]|nr:hypothetical protein BgiMline_000050 [Biomphalaria glabrata]
MLIRSTKIVTTNPTPRGLTIQSYRKRKTISVSTVSQSQLWPSRHFRSPTAEQLAVSTVSQPQLWPSRHLDHRQQSNWQYPLSVSHNSGPADT